MKSAKWLTCAAVAFAVACGGGDGGGETTSGAGGPKLDTAARQAEWAWLQKAQRDIAAKREELTSLRGESANGAAVAPQIDATNTEISQLSEEFGRRLAEYINADPPLVGEPMRPEQLAAMRMKSGEDLAIAREFIELGGDYRRAIDILNQALAIDPDNAELKAAVADSEAKRYMNAARFAAVKRGMSEGEVINALGRPLIRNIRDYPEKRVSAWFYPKSESGEAAGVFFNAEHKVYSTDFDAVRAVDAGATQQ